MTDEIITKNFDHVDNVKQRRWILFSICMLAVMLTADYTAINIAIPAMSETFNTNLTTIQWVLSAYMLAWGTLVIPAGRLSDLYGKRRLFLIGTTLFTFSSALCGLAPNAWFLIASRVLQGIGGALLLPSLYTLVFTAYPESQRGKAMGIFTAALSVGMAIGPTMGGMLTHYLSWRYIFLVNLPLGICSILILFFSVAKEPKKLLDEPMDILGSIFQALIIVLFMFGIDQVKQVGITAPITLAIFSAVIILLPIFIFMEKSKKHPILRMSLFSNKPFLGCILSYILMGYNFAAILIIGALYLQNALNYTAFEAGLTFLAMTVSFGILSVYGGRLADRVQKRIPIIAGGIGMIIATFCFSLLNLSSPLWIILSVLALAGLGFGLAFPALNLAMMSSVKDEELNVASGTYNMFGTIGNTIGLILSAVSIVYFGKNKLFALVESLHIQLSHLQQQTLLNVIGSAHYDEHDLTAFSAQQIPQVMHTLHEAFIYAMSSSIHIALGFGILSVVLAMVLIRDKRPS